MISNHRHLGCLQRLLKAAGVPANLPAEAVAEALLQLQLQGQAATLAYNTSLRAACQSLSIAQSAALPTQLPLLRSLHSTTAALGAEDVVPPAAPAEASTQDPSTEPPAQTLADAAASVLQQPAGPIGVAQEPAGPTHAVLDLASAVSAAQNQEQHRRAQRKQQAQPQKRAQKQQEQGVFASRLFSLSQQLTQDVEQVKMAERVQQVKQKLQRMQTQQQQRQQQQQQQQQDSVIAAGAGAPAGTAPAGLSVQAQRQQQQQAHLAPTLNLAQALETLGQPKLSAYELLVQQRQRQQEQALQELEKPNLSVSELRLQQQQQGQQAADKPSAPHSQQQPPRRAVGLPSLEAVIRAHPQLLAKARRQKQLQQQQQAQPPGGYKLPMLLEYTLQQQRQQPAAPVAAAAQQRLSPHPSGSSSSDLLAAEDWDADVAAPAAGQARYSNWVDLDVTQVVPRDAHDTFLGVWPDLSSLPALQLADLLVDVDISDADVATADVSDLEEMQQLPSAAEADAGLVVELREQQQQRQGWGDGGGTHVESLQAAALQEATAAAQEAAGDSTEDEAAQWQEESLGALFAGSGSWEGLSGLGSSDAAAAAAADAEAELAQLWQADASTAAEEGADADPELAQLSQGDAAVAADAAAADAVLMQLQQQQQRLQQAAATAGLDGATAPSHAATPAAAAAAAAAAAGDWECEEVVVRPRWSVDTMLDSSDGLTVDSTAGLISSSSSSSASGGGLLGGDLVLDGSEWVLTDIDADSEVQGGGEGQYGDSLDEVATAQAALRASDAAAAAFAAANPSQLQWPAHMPIILAWQRALQQLEIEPQLAGAFFLDGVTGGSSSSSAFGGTASGRTVQGQQQPFAWMYQAAGSPGGDAGGQAPSPVVQHILRCMQDMQPNGNWRFELQQQPLLRRKPWAPFDSSLTQYVQQRKQQPQEQQQLWGSEQLSQQRQKQQQQLAGSVEASQRLQAQQQQQQQAQPQPQQQQQEGKQAKHGWLEFGRDLWAAAKDAYWFSSNKGSSSSRGSGGGGAAATMITTTSSEGAWDDDEQQEEPPPAAAAVAEEVTTAAAVAAASNDQPIRGRNFVLQPQKLPHSEEELLLLARVTEMSAGTCWEAPMWSVFTQQGTQVPKGRSELQYTGGDVRKGRKPLSEPWEEAVKRREQERQEQAQREQQRLQQAQVRSAALKQQAAAAAAAAVEDWFAPVTYAAFAAVHKTGQLVLLPVYTSLYSTPAVSTSLDTVSDGSNSSSEEAAEAFWDGPADVTAAGNVAQQRAATAAAVAVGLQAVPPYKPGWDPLARCWQGRYLPVAAVPSRAELAAELQQRAQLGQAVIQRARAHAPVDLRLQPDAAHDVILEEIQGCGTAAALLECMQQYAHYLDRYPDLPAAALQQAAKVWTGPAIAGAAAAAAAESPLGRAAASAAAAQAVLRAAGPETGKGRRKHKPLPLKLQLPVAAVPSVDAAPTGAAAAAAAAAAAPAVSMPDITAAFAGGVSAHAAAAAAGGNLDMLQQHQPVQLQLTDKPLLERDAAGSVFETLVQWLTKQHERPVEQLRDLGPPALHADLMPQRSSSSSSGTADGAASAADLRPSKQQCLLQLLSLGITHRGRLLPQGVSLLQLLKVQLVQQLPESTVLDLSQHILSPLSGLQSWQVDEQRAAFKLVQSGLVALQPQALLQLLQLLTTQSHLAALPHELQQAPASLYNAVLARLAVQAKAVLDGQTGEVWKEFAGAAPQLLRLAEQACLSAGTLALEAQQEGIVLPGTSYLEGSVAPKAVKGAGGEEHRNWVLQQHQAHVKLLRSWRKQAAVTPVVADAVVKAAASGHLMLVAAVLKPILSAPTQQQQLQAAQVAGLLQLLAFSRPFVSYSSASDARHVAARFGVPGDGLWAGSAAFARLPEAAMGWLVQQQGPSKPLQQVSQAAALKTLWAAFQLQLPLKHIGAAVSSLCEPLQATAAGAAESTGPAADGTWPVGRDLWQAVDDAAHNSSSSGSSSSSSSSGTRTYLHGWSAPDLQQLMVLTRIGGFAFHPAHWDVVASAAALRLHELAAAVATGRLPAEFTVNLAAYAPGGPTAAAKADIGRHRSSAGGSDTSDHQRISRMVDAACDMSFVVTSRDLYYPELVDALQDLVVNAAKVRRNKYSGVHSSRAQYLTPHVLSKVLYCLAYFNTCSAETSAAIRQLLPPLLRGLKQQGLSRAAWALAVLDEGEPRVWRDVAKAIQRLERGAAGPTYGEEEGDADAAVSVEEKAPYFAQWTYTQVHQANVFVEHCVPDAAPLLPAKLAAKALRLHVTQAQDPTVSQLQRDVGHVLGEMQASQTSQLSSYELEHKTVLGSTDIKVMMKGAAHWVAIEVDGPYHYAKNDPYTRTQRNGSTMLRDRLLQVKGFSVLPLPYWELRNKKAAGPDVTLPWLQQLLVKAAARAPPAGADRRRGAKMIELESYTDTL